MDVITQTKHYFSSFQTANLVEGITGLSSHYIIPSGSCKVHRRASNGHCFFSTSNNVRTMASKLWCKDLHWLPHGCCTQMPAWQETYALSYQTLMAVPAPIFSIFDLKKNEPANVKIKENRKQPGTLQMTLKSFPRGEKVNKNFIFLYFTFLEPLCLGEVFFSPKPFFVKMCVFAAPW